MFSVLARVNGKTGKLLERVRYRPYGEARHQWGHDVDGDGDADSADQSIVQTASAASAVIGDANYDVDADLDRDGDVDTADEAAWSAKGSKTAMADGAISDTDAVIGWSGYISADVTGMYHVRHRAYSVTAGRWVIRDPKQYIDGGNLYVYTKSNPMLYTDPSGQVAWPVVPVIGGGLLWYGAYISCIDRSGLEANICLQGCVNRYGLGGSVGCDLVRNLNCLLCCVDEADAMRSRCLGIDPSSVRMNMQNCW